MTSTSQCAPALPLPDHTQLPDSDGVPVDNVTQPMLATLLTEALLPVLRQRHPESDYFVGQDNGIYWKHTAPPLDGCRSPDWYYVPGVPHLLDGVMRRSYVLWQELVAPYILLEFASGDGSEERDRTPGKGKFWIYERRIRPAFYGIFEMYTDRLEMYHLVEEHFEKLAPNPQGRYPMPLLGVELGTWPGVYRDYERQWLRWWDTQGQLLPTDGERATEAAARAEQARQRAEQAEQRAARLAEKLRSLGIEPNGA